MSDIQKTDPGESAQPAHRTHDKSHHSGKKHQHKKKVLTASASTVPAPTAQDGEPVGGSSKDSSTPPKVSQHLPLLKQNMSQLITT